MDMNELSKMYLQPLVEKTAFPPQVAYGNLLSDGRLNFTTSSLDDVDSILDYIREKENPQYEIFIDKQENQNFLFVLCFYVGAVAAQNSSQTVRWFDYDGMIKEIPDNGKMFPQCFETAITCILNRAGFFVPLSSICSRLFDTPTEKSVRFSAGAFMPSPSPTEKRTEKKPWWKFK